jgi:hypothetical protein
MRLSELNLNPGETLTIQISGDGLTATIKLADREFDSELRFETRAENDNATMFDGCLETVRASIDYRHLHRSSAGWYRLSKNATVTNATPPPYTKARKEMDAWKDDTPVTVTMTVPNWVAKHIADEVVRLKETPR